MADMNKVLCNVQQILTPAQQLQARTNIGAVGYSDLFAQYNDAKKHYKFDVCLHNGKLYMANFFSPEGAFDVNKWDECSFADVNRKYSCPFSVQLESCEYDYSSFSYNPFCRLFVGNLNYRLSSSISGSSWTPILATPVGEGPNVYGAARGPSVGNTSYTTLVDTQMYTDTGQAYIRMQPVNSSYGLDTVAIVGFDRAG